jgi:hypothetical protein
MSKRMKPVKVPNILPCGCMAFGTKLKVNRESITIMNGRKVCRHGSVWDLSWVMTGWIKSKVGRPRGPYKDKEAKR